MTFQDDLNRILRERLAAAGVADPDSYRAEVDTTPLLVKQHAAYLPVSTEQALDAGIITEEQARAQGWTPYVLPPISWRSRLRFRWWEWRERTGRKVGGWIAGVDLTERDED